MNEKIYTGNNQTGEVFTEVQRMRHPLFWLVFLLLAGLMGYGFVMQIFYSIPVGQNPAPDWVVWAGLFFVLGLLWLGWFVKLEVKVSKDGIEYRYPPFINHRKLVGWDELRSARVRKYNPVFEYGGWGVRMCFPAGRAYNVQGNMGLQLEFLNGKKLLIGCRDAKALESMLKRLKEKYQIQQISHN